MIYVGIDVAKDKHDCCILGENGQVVRETFTVSNSRDGFELLLKAIQQAAHSGADSQIKAGLEATGHYSVNLVAFLRSSGIEPVVFNPLQVNQYRKSQSLRKTKTDKVDARYIAQLVMSADPNPVNISYQILELKALTRNRHRLVWEQTRIKQNVSRLVDLLFPELNSLKGALGKISFQAMLLELPSAMAITTCRIDRLTSILSKHSYGKFSRDKSNQIKELAKNSIGLNSPAHAFELQMTLQHLSFIRQQVRQVERAIFVAIRVIQTPLLSIPGIGVTLAAVILAEIGDIWLFGSPDKLQAFAGLEPSTFQSGKFNGDRCRMVKRGSPHLRWALLQAARLAARHCPTFRDYLGTKLAQGKHYNVALSHTAKKLIRVIHRLLTTNQIFEAQVS
jgi:transposase